MAHLALRLLALALLLAALLARDLAIHDVRLAHAHVLGLDELAARLLGLGRALGLGAVRVEVAGRALVIEEELCRDAAGLDLALARRGVLELALGQVGRRRQLLVGRELQVVVPPREREDVVAIVIVVRHQLRVVVSEHTLVLALEHAVVLCPYWGGLALRVSLFVAASFMSTKLTGADSSSLPLPEPLSEPEPLADPLSEPSSLSDPLPSSLSSSLPLSSSPLSSSLSLANR